VTTRIATLVVGAFVVGLALHNLVMAGLWEAGVRGGALDVVSAWKEALLAAALLLACWRLRGLPPLVAADWLALAYTLFVLVYAVLPQDWLDGGASTRGVLYGLRHDLVPVAAYALGRLVVVSAEERRRLGWLSLAVGVALAGWGLVDVYAVPLQWWRDSGVPGWFGEQLTLNYTKGLSGLPENWLYNTGNEEHPLRRLVSTLLSPLATSYLLVVALLFAASRRRLGVVPAVTSVVCFAGLLWTHTRAATIALAIGLAALAAMQRRWTPLLLAGLTVGLSVAFFAVYTDIGPKTSFTPSELAYQRQHAQEEGATTGDAFSGNESSLSGHWRILRDGVDTVVHHPQGFGLGNAGTEAKRTGVEIKAGESIYTQFGVDIGVVGTLVFVAWSLLLVVRLWPRSPWLCAAFLAVLAVGLQTDVLGVHWIVYVLYALIGSAVSVHAPSRYGEVS
jgi:hypothetical protein